MKRERKEVVHQAENNRGRRQEVGKRNHVSKKEMRKPKMIVTRKKIEKRENDGGNK